MMQTDREWKLRESSSLRECISKGARSKVMTDSPGDLETMRIRTSENYCSRLSRPRLIALITAFAVSRRPDL